MFDVVIDAFESLGILRQLSLHLFGADKKRFQIWPRALDLADKQEQHHFEEFLQYSTRLVDYREGRLWMLLRNQE